MVATISPLAVPSLFAAPPNVTQPLATAVAVDLADPQSLVQIRISKPLQILDNPWLLQTWPLLEGSPAIRNAVEGGGTGRLIETQQFLQRASGLPWREAIDKLTAGGVEIALQKRISPLVPELQVRHPFSSLLIIHAADEKLLTRFLTAADTERTQQLAARARGPSTDAPVPQVSRYTYRNQTCTKVLKSPAQPDEFYVAIGRHFLFSTDEKVLEQGINRALDGVPAASKETSSAPSVPVPLIRFALRLDLLRNFQEGRELLQFPASHPWIIPFVGTWDSLRRSDQIQGTLHLESTGLRLRVRSSAGTTGMPDGLKQAITADSKDPLLPSLQIPNSVCTLNLYRDAGQLWEHRADWLTSDGAKLVEEWNRLPQAQIPELDFLKSLQYLGPHWRLAMALPPETAERTKRRDLLPAFAVTVDLRDEAAFRREVLDRLEKYLKSDAIKAQGRLESWEHHGTQVSQFHWNPPAFPPGFQRNPGDFRGPRGGRPGERRGGPAPAGDAKPNDTKKADAKPADGKPNEPQPIPAVASVKPEDAKPGDHRAAEGKFGKGRPEGVGGGRNFRGGPHHAWRRRSGISMFRHMHPAFAIHNGQLIVGSNAEITRQTIDELERLSQNPAAPPARTTLSGEQFLSLEHLADHLRSRERILTWRLMRSAQLPEEQAKQELSTIAAVLTQLGDLTYRESATETTTQIDIRLGKPSR